MQSYFSVDSSNDGCAYLHANPVDNVKVLVLKYRLNQGNCKHQDGIEIAFPRWLFLVCGEID